MLENLRGIGILKAKDKLEFSRKGGGTDQINNQWDKVGKEKTFDAGHSWIYNSFAARG